MKNRTFGHLFASLASLALMGTLQAEPPKYSEADELFTLKIAPLLSEKCNGCHGDDPEDIDGDYNMLTREGLLAGGETFGKDVIVPGKAAESFILESVKWEDPDFEMPPKENDRLTQEQIADLEKWINAGAPWPDEKTQVAIREVESKKKVTAEGMIVETSGGLGDEWTYRRYKPEDIWAFLPVKKPEVPENESTNPVDSFVFAKLEEAGFELGAEASPRHLLRRASFDLTGLPPTKEETEAFLKAWEVDSEKAWEAEIDRLLASPHYGERWAQHWLDIARYADTGGMSNDYERSNAWRYRDYVIRAFNEDKPYDEFIIEQLAGDELAEKSLRKRMGGDPKKIKPARVNGNYTPEEAEQIVATGFLRMGPWDDAMVKKPEARQIYLDDVVNSVGQTFLATTMRCFKCHDHKFDPLPTKDYYRIYATFAATQHAERAVPYLEEENLDGFEEGKAHVQKMWEFANLEQHKIQTKQENAAKKWYEENGLEYKNEADRK
ncbi:MAG: DUF1549 domain-containing protein, partial [Verrucomicrobiales bacterium]|nr:DUF1549 domain-containing protein [Verrucomicrobiales bacterium]